MVTLRLCRYYYAPGSGVYLHLGQTLAFCTHQEAIRWFGIRSGTSSLCHMCYSSYEIIVAHAQAARLDTLQFTHHDDQNCGNMAIEIWDVRPSAANISRAACTTARMALAIKRFRPLAGFPAHAVMTR